MAAQYHAIWAFLVPHRPSEGGKEKKIPKGDSFIFNTAHSVKDTRVKVGSLLSPAY